MKNYILDNKWLMLAMIALAVAIQFGIVPHAAATGIAFVGIGATDITQAFVQQWDTSIRAAAQQKNSRLMSAVTDRGTIVGDGFTINNMGSIELDANTVRHGDTEWSDIAHTNRLATMQDFYKALPLDRNDIPKMIVNPVTGGDYMQQLINARNRKIDAAIYAAMGGTINSKDGVTANTLPAGQKIAVGGTAFTKAKVIQARSIFRANEADDESGEELFIMYNDKAMATILADTTLTSADWMATNMMQNGSGGMLQNGKVGTSWLGFTWIPYQGIALVSTTYSTFAWCKSGIHFGKGYEEGNVTRRGDKKDLWQVSMGASYGAGRQDELKVVQIDYTA